MRKIFTFILLAAALLVSVPSWAYVEGAERNLGYYELPLIGHWGNTNDFGTICLPERIVAVQGITIYDVKCVDVNPQDTNDVVRLVVVEHAKCDRNTQFILDPWQEGGDDAPWCPDKDNPGSCEGKSYIDWAEKGYDYEKEEALQLNYPRMKAGAAYFYNVCSGVTTLEGRKVYVDANDVATEPVCRNGFYGTLQETTFNTPVTVLTKNTTTGTQYIETVTKATIPANRGYFKGNFECVPWRWNTDDPYYKAHPEIYGTKNPRHNPCTGEIMDEEETAEAPSRMVAFNVGTRDAATGLYPIDLEHPIYFNQETNKRIENGQLIIEAADGSIYNAFGQKLR